MSKFRYALGESRGILEDRLTFGENDNEFILFNKVLREIFKAQFSSLQDSELKNLNADLSTGFKEATGKQNEKFIHAFTIACEWFLVGLLGQALPKTDALDKKLESIRIEFEGLSKLLQQFHGVVLAMTQQTREAFKGLKFEGGTSIGALNYLYPESKDKLGHKSHLYGLREAMREERSQSNSLAPFTDNSSGQQKRLVDFCKGTVSQSSKRSRQA